MTDLPFSFELPWRGKPKPRPRFSSSTEHKAYNPAEYTEWKNDIAQLVLMKGLPSVHGKVRLDLLFRSESVNVRVIPVLGEYERAMYVTADIDNLSGGIMDALETAGTFDNDRDVMELRASIQRRK
jgi:Holliday junction resolvase RusA-like endonuclease